MQAVLKRMRHSEAVNGWLFVLPVLIGLGLFLVYPIGMALWVSFTDWSGLTPPGDASYVGLDNYRALLTESGLQRFDFATSIRNNLYYVLGVVPVQTALAFVLAVIVNQKFLKGKGFFRLAYYFPSITGSIAISLIFIFLFNSSGPVNRTLQIISPLDRNINWLENPNGLIHNAYFALGFTDPPAFLANTEFMDLSLWAWVAGPSMTMYMIMLLATWTTTGTLMLIFLAGLQNISTEVEEATAVDGASALQRFFYVTVPMMRPTLFFVLTVGLIGTWQVFDQIFAISAGGPRKTTLTPAYLVYRDGFQNSQMGVATAIAFMLFVLIVVLTLIQRRVIGPDEQ